MASFLRGRDSFFRFSFKFQGRSKSEARFGFNIEARFGFTHVPILSPKMAQVVGLGLFYPEWGWAFQNIPLNLALPSECGGRCATEAMASGLAAAATWIETRKLNATLAALPNHAESC